ncbi:MAG: cytochrome o ubiquinol oxidase subunit IV [Caulobacteraceae bacterium]|nr:cytochrome o ubiquinol oxidase subunit IV [Caulobacteraceae bacterium]
MTDHHSEDIAHRVEGGDVAPGDVIHGEFTAGWRTYVLGLAIAIGLTIASFWVAQTHLIYGPAIDMALATLAVAQMGIHLIFFLHITTGPDNTNNVLALAFGILVVFLVIFGSIWIMIHMNQSMMPPTGMPAPQSGGM